MHEQIRTKKIADIEERAASSNGLLSDAEQSVVRELLSEAEGDIKSLDAHISQLQQRRAEGLARIERLRLGIAPQKRVPPEILSKIFVYTMDEQALPLPPRSNGPIWNVLWVCSRWRAIAITEPIIWSQIEATELEDREALNPLLHDIFANRGRGGLITYHAPRVSNTQAWASLLSLLAAHPSRLRHIDITFKDFSPSLLEAPPVRLDCLESVSISLRWRYNNNAAPVADFFTSTTLTKVTLLIYTAPPPSEWLNRAPLPWAQLTDIIIGAVPVSVMESILKQCTCLAGCTVSLSGDLTRQNVSSHPILLEHLLALLFDTASNFPSTEYLLDRLTAPALKELGFENQVWEKLPKKSILGLVTRSTCSLEVLTTLQPSLKEQEIVPIMRAMPSLTELHIDPKTCIADSTIDAIRMEGLAPRLRILHRLWVSSLLPFIRLLESRCKEEGGESRGIREASVLLRKGHPDFHEGTCQAALAQLRECGVDIEVSSM